jgi:hypothetical protein
MLVSFVPPTNPLRRGSALIQTEHQAGVGCRDEVGIVAGAHGGRSRVPSGGLQELDHHPSRDTVEVGGRLVCEEDARPRS